MEASSDRHWEAASELVQAIEDALALLRSVFAENVDARAESSQIQIDLWLRFFMTYMVLHSRSRHIKRLKPHTCEQAREVTVDPHPPMGAWWTPQAQLRMET